MFGLGRKQRVEVAANGVEHHTYLGHNVGIFHEGGDLYVMLAMRNFVLTSERITAGSMGEARKTANEVLDAKEVANA
jgi:hypothetical protein